MIMCACFSFIQNAATKFSTREFIRERALVEDALNKGIRDKLSGPCCELGCEDNTHCTYHTIYY